MVEPIEILEFNEAVEKGENSSSPFDFYVDTDKLLEISSKLSNLESKISDIVNEISNLKIADNWHGEDAELFISKIASTKELKNDICTNISKLSGAYKDLAKFVEDNNERISSIINNSF